MADSKINLDDVQRWRIPKGTVIICPNRRCHAFIGVVQEDIRHGTQLKSSLFKGPGIRANGTTKCTKCGISWYHADSGRFWTNQGWMPKKIEVVPG